MIQIKDKQIFSTDKYLHRLGTEVYFKRCFMLPTDKKEDFEEVDEKVANLETQVKDLTDRITVLENK